MNIHNFIETHRYGWNPDTQTMCGMEYYDFERNVINAFKDNRFTFIKKSRQMHITTLLACYVAKEMLFGDNKSIVYASVKLKISKLFLLKVKQQMLKFNPDIKFERDNSEVLSVNGNTLWVITSTIDAMCGIGADLLILDEAAFIDNIEEFYSGVITSLSTGGRAILASTPNGFNFFYKIYLDILNGLNDYKLIELTYKDNPRFNEDWFKQMCLGLNNDKITIQQELLGEFIEEPKKEKKQTKDYQILFRVDDNTYNNIGRKLMELDMTLSEYMRSLIEKDLK